MAPRLSWPRRSSTVAKGGKEVVNTLDLAEQARALSIGASRGAMGASTNLTPEQVAGLKAAGMDPALPFSPGEPIRQFWPEGSAPRAWDFPVGYNINSRPRAASSKASFDTLKAILGSYDVARMCIEHRIDDVRSLDWKVTAKDGYSGDVGDAIQQAQVFLAKPDGVTPFDGWLQTWLEDVLRYDAGALYKGRLRNGDLGGLEVVDGTTIAPLTDYTGRRPLGEAPAFVQFVSGVPSVWLRNQDLIYQPFRSQPESLYGLAPIEWLLVNANTDLRFQWHFLMYFTEGSLPATFMEAPPDFTSATQINEFQAIWDDLMEGDQAKKHKVKWVPHGATPHPVRNEAFDPEFPLYLMRKTCAAYKVTPNDLGFTDDVNRATGETQVSVQFRVSTLPLLKYVQNILNDVLQIDLGLPVKFEFKPAGEMEDRLGEAQAWKLWVDMGAASPDEARETVLGLPVDPNGAVPRFYNARTGPVPLSSIIAAAGKDIDPETLSPKPGTVDFLEPGAPVDTIVPSTEPDADILPPADPKAPKPGEAGAAPAKAPAPGAKAAPVAKELRAFARYAKARESDVTKGKALRPFAWEHVTGADALTLNHLLRESPSAAAESALTLARRLEP